MPSLTTLLACGMVLGLLFSTRYLAQPFVWKHWPADVVLAGWIEVLWGRVLVGVTLALSWWIAWKVSAPRAGDALPRILTLCSGAAAGELLLLALDAPDAAAGFAALAGRVVRWAAVIIVLVSLYRIWLRRKSEDAARRLADERSVQGEAQLTRMRLLALQAQIEPHFLFNTLATVQRLAHTSRESGTRLLDHLIDFVRLHGEVVPERPGWTLLQEQELVGSYLSVIALRMDGRLDVDVQIDPAVLQAQFPPLLLATLVENAVKHGISPLPEGGAIQLRAAREGNRLRAEVRDTGVGFAGESGSGIGLANSRARLRTLHGNQASLVLTSNTPRGVVATVELPLQRAHACQPSR